MATKGELEYYYIFYRTLSNYAAHPSLDALTYRFDENAELIDFGPNGDIVDLTQCGELPVYIRLSVLPIICRTS